MKVPILLILLLSVSYASTFGYSRINIERTWTIEDPQNGTFEFTGSIAANTSNQHVIYLSTEPQMEQYVQDDGSIRLHYKGKVENGTAVLKATAIVNVDYNTDILADSALPEGQRNYTLLTEPDGAISQQALQLAQDGSSLKTIRDIVNWVHSNVEYDISYWSASKSARDVFAERRGVCVEYTHLLISMLRSLGFDTRYASGYVQGASWQPHAWAEVYVPGYGWLPADATFGQVGTLDSSHVVFHYGTDQSDVYDVLMIKNPGATIEVDDDVSASFSSEDPKGISLLMEVDQESYVTDVTITSNRSDYSFGSFVFNLPEGYGGPSSSVLLLAPNETVHMFSGLNHSLIKDGYEYDLQMSASFNDAKDEVRFIVSPGNGNGNGEEPQPTAASPCPSAILLLLAPAALLVKS